MNRLQVGDECEFKKYHPKPEDIKPPYVSAQCLFCGFEVREIAKTNHRQNQYKFN
jgi:hypothetical protein